MLLRVFYSRLSYLVGFLLMSVMPLLAQPPGCPDVDAGPDVLLPCGVNCANLNASAFQTGATTSYGVSSVPYSPPFPFTGGTQIFINTDDVWSSVINLPFTFCFYGNSFNQILIGTNGVLTFDVAQANNYCEWSYSASIPSPGPPPGGIYNNSINGVYHDIDPSVSTVVIFPPSVVYPANINYAVLGSAPCRTFVVNYSTVPHYSCNSLRSTSQIVLYETTNVIEVYVQNKPTCNIWNSGRSLIGIQNATGTQGVTPPGRNTGNWTTSNEAWRFTPNGTSIVSVEWLQGTSVIGSGNSVQVCPAAATTYTAKATYLPCAGGTPVVVTDNVNVSLAGTLQLSITSSQNVSCFGGTNGTATASISGGTSPVNYGWTDGGSSLTRTNLSAGTYIFTATDASNCTRSDTVVITQPTQLVVTVPDVSQINCSGSGTGTLVASVSGGAYPYTYSWSSNPAETDSILDNVLPGSYTLTVTTVGGCSATDVGTLTIQAGGNTVAFGTPVVSNVLCNGDSNGAITLNVTGGSGVYSYTWNNGNTTPSSNTLAAGIYNITVDDGADCTASATYAITEPQVLLIDSANVSNIGCDGAVLGAISTYTSGGTAPLNYNWSRLSDGQTYSGQNLTGLVAATYNLSVSDNNGCSVTASYQITEAVPLLFTQGSTNATCNGGSDGTATITITSGTPPYAYNWNNTGPTSNATLSGISAGVVTVVIADAGCSVTASFTITEPTAVQINQLSQNNVSCVGGADGSISAEAAGGTSGSSGYTYLWSNQQTGATANNLSAGTYTVTATDENLCTAEQSYTITEPAGITATAIVTDATCYQAANGSIALTPSGGTAPYSYLWADAQTTQTAFGLLAGTYTSIVTDNNGCTAVFSNTVAEPADLIISTSVTPVKCVGDANGTISVSAVGGTTPYNFSATIDGSNFVFATNGVIEGLAVGTYQVIVSDNNGCTKVVLAIVPNASLDNFSTATDSTSCYGDNYNDGAAYVVATSIQNGPYEYSLDGGLYQYSGDFYNISAGEHTVTAINQFGCITQIPLYVFEPLPIVVDVVPDTLLLPLGESGSVMVNYLNATNVNFSWTPAFGLSCSDCPNPTASNYQMADYVVTVSMQNGSSICYGSATLHVDVLPHEPIFIPNSFSPNGDGNNDLFMVYGADLKTVDMKIFNRWGELVYATNNAFQGWDGTYKGQLQLPQVFTYSVQVTFLDDKKSEKKGSIMLLR